MSNYTKYLLDFFHYLPTEAKNATSLLPGGRVSQEIIFFANKQFRELADSDRNRAILTSAHSPMTVLHCIPGTTFQQLAHPLRLGTQPATTQLAALRPLKSKYPSELPII